MIRILTLADSGLWDATIRSVPHYDVHQLSAYVRAFARDQNAEPLLVWYEDDGGVALQTVMKRDVATSGRLESLVEPGQWFDLVTPYGYGGFLVEGSINWGNLRREYSKFCDEQSVVCEFVRFFLDSEYAYHFSGSTRIAMSNVVRSLSLSEEEIWSDYEHKVRKNVKKAARAGLQFEVDTAGDRLDDFLRIYYGTMGRTGASEEFFFSSDFFDDLKQLEENVAWVHVLHDDKVVSSELVLLDSDRAYSFLGGTDSGYFEMRPNDFLKHGVILWARSQGLRCFVLGGGYGSDDGIFRYKRSFAPSGVSDFRVGSITYDPLAYARLCSLSAAPDNVKYFPAYRASTAAKP